MTIAEPNSLFLGYAVKQLLPAPANFTDNRVTHIASVSECIAKRPPDWVQRWDFNDAGLYNTSDEALAAAHSQLNTPTLTPPWRLFAYSFYPIRFDHFGGAATIDPASIFNITTLATIDPAFALLGYDIVQRSSEPRPGKSDNNQAFGGFACSPLSCNAMSIARANTRRIASPNTRPINSYCLLDHWDDATIAARDIAIAQPEPGCYYIFAVHIRNN